METHMNTEPGLTHFKSLRVYRFLGDCNTFAETWERLLFMWSRQRW